MLLPRVLRALAVLLVREASSEQVARTALMSRVGVRACSVEVVG